MRSFAVNGVEQLDFANVVSSLDVGLFIPTGANNIPDRNILKKNINFFINEETVL
jgi:hypothetical protein